MILVAPSGCTSLTVTEDNAYFLAISGDRTAYCDVGTSCTDEGDFEATETTITFDPGSEFEATASYSITGNQMSMTATFEGLTLIATLAQNGG